MLKALQAMKVQGERFLKGNILPVPPSILLQVDSHLLAMTALLTGNALKNSEIMLGAERYMPLMHTNGLRILTSKDKC